MNAPVAIGRNALVQLQRAAKQCWGWVDTDGLAAAGHGVRWTRCRSVGTRTLRVPQVSLASRFCERCAAAAIENGWTDAFALDDVVTDENYADALAAIFAELLTSNPTAALAEAVTALESKYSRVSFADTIAGAGDGYTWGWLREALADEIEGWE